MSRLRDIPQEHLAICRALVAHALGQGPEPEDSKQLDDFQSWVLYLSGAMGEEDYECVVRLNSLEFEDDRVRFVLGLDDDAPINDKQRLAHAREFIDTYGDDGVRDPRYAESFELPSPEGTRVYYCCVAQFAGQGGVYADWYGCFLDRRAFGDVLRIEGYWILSDPASRIPDSALLDRWYHPDPRSGP